MARTDLLQTIADELGWPMSLAARAIPALVVLHDLGKFAPVFQAKVPGCWPIAALGPVPAQVDGDPGHGRTGWTLFDELCDADKLLAFRGWSKAAAHALMEPVFGHHGRPVLFFDGPPLDLFGRKRAALHVAAAFVERSAGLFELDAPLPEVDVAQARRVSWRLAGLMILADWVGSSQAWFPYASADMELEVYWQEVALPQALRALGEAGLQSAQAAPFKGHAGLIDDALQPTSAQAWAETVELPDGPLLVVLEDVTGSGKTEAALLLVHRLLAAGRARGLIMALPTQATANAMFGRMGALYRRSFTDGAEPSLALAHGASQIHPGFQQALRIGGESLAKGDESSAACTAWLGSEGRKAFLADVGIATIDQAILGILPAKYQALRLLGMAERVLVIDEAHAYDAYVGRELDELVRWQSALGGHTIILSATLPPVRRNQLLAAYAGGSAVPARENAGYPLVTLAHREGATNVALTPRADLVRRVAVERAKAVDEVVSEIRAAAAAGAAVAWIRNAVDDVLEAQNLLAAHGIDPIVFHARFAMSDRLATESVILEKFGKNSAGIARSGVVVASQVIEMSLDLDFDLIVTDLAPVDSILQRMGRTWRHVRADRPVAGPRILILAPEPIDAPTKEWLGPVLARTGFVYADHAVLWRTARSLFAKPTISIPNDVPDLIGYVYSDVPEVPEGLAAAFDKSEGTRKAQTSVAGTNVLSFDKGYVDSNGAWGSEIRIPTRDAVDTLTFRLARLENGRLVSWSNGESDAHAWALSEIKLRRNRAAGQATDQQVGEALLTAAKAGWKEFEREVPLLVLYPNPDGTWTGEVADRKGRPVAVSYDSGTGLRFVPPDPSS